MVVTYQTPKKSVGLAIFLSLAFGFLGFIYIDEFIGIVGAITTLVVGFYYYGLSIYVAPLLPASVLEYLLILLIIPAVIRLSLPFIAFYRIKQFNQSIDALINENELEKEFRNQVMEHYPAFMAGHVLSKR